MLREGDRIGTDPVSFERMGEELTVRTETNVEFTAYIVFDVDWTHQSVEIWGDGGLKEFTSFTNEDGRKRQVHAQRDGDVCIVESTGGHREFPADVIPGTLWHPGSRCISSSCSIPSRAAFARSRSATAARNSSRSRATPSRPGTIASVGT